MSSSFASVLERPAIQVERWPSDLPLFALTLITSVVLWIFALVSMVGILYAAILGVFFFVMHLGFVAHLRGGAVRLGHDQFPELYERISELSIRMGIRKVPEVYLMQAGGSLNAFATRFLGANIVVLFSDLLDACGDNEAARDMIIAHELGHIKENHLRWHWLLLPASLIPFLGTAYSRAREYTCDRYGLAGAGDLDGALLGMTILAVGGTHAPKVNRQALVRQRATFNSGWMTIGEWLSTHPPLVKRLVALDPSLGLEEAESEQGPLRAFGIIGFLGLSFLFLSVFALTKFAGMVNQINGQAQAQRQSSPPHEAPANAGEQVQLGFATLSAAAMFEVNAGRGLPADDQALYVAWNAQHPGQPEPLDPYDGNRFGYEPAESGFNLWSSGPDQAPGTDDDLIYNSPNYTGSLQQ